MDIGQFPVVDPGNLGSRVISTKALFPHLDDVQQLQALDNFRKVYEHRHGPTDPLRIYSSQLPEAEQDEMRKDRPLEYFDRLPDFACDYFYRLISKAAAQGDMAKMDKDAQGLFVALNKRRRLYQQQTRSKETPPSASN